MPTRVHEFPLFWIPLLPLIGAAINLVFGRKLSRRTVHFIACASVGAAAVVAFAAVLTELMPQWWAARKSAAAPDPMVRDVAFTWIQSGSFRADLSFLLDPLSAIMIMTVTFVGFLIHVYSMGYMAHDPRPHAYFGYLNLFTGSMLILVLGDSLPIMFIGWEGVGVCSYLLIGFWFDKEKNANAGRKAFVVNRIGDFAFLLGIFLLFKELGTVQYLSMNAVATKLSAPLWGQTVAFWSGLFLFIGACGKSAQIPLYVWLPDAMAGPTPVSALIHAATMVTAGVYMVTRMGFLYLQAPTIMAIIATVGTLTAVLAAAIGFAQTDIKKVLAYSTVSQLGFMFAAAGSGAFVAAIFHLFTHAFFKAGLFLGAGSVMHAMGDRTEIMEMGGLRHKIPTTHKTFLIYCLAIAGIIPFAGFFSKDEILLGAFTAHWHGWPAWYGKLIWATLLLTALGTAFYMWRLYFLVFWGESRADAETQAHIHESPAVMTVPLVVLAVGAVVLGFLGLPHIEGVHLPTFMGSWLGMTQDTWKGVTLPAHHVSAATSLGLMVIALIAGLIGIGAAYSLYSKGPDRVRGLVASIQPLYKLVYNKFYVDELYDLIIVRPFRFLANVWYQFIDRVIIDLILVNGAAFVADVFGRLLRFVQNGDVQRYLAAMVFGLFAMLLWTNCDQKVGFKATGSASEMKFVAEYDVGPNFKNPEVVWDFNDDGKPDSTGKEVTWQFGAPGKYKVTMWVGDTVYAKVAHKVTRQVEVK